MSGLSEGSSRRYGMSHEIRKATRADASALLKLIVALAQFEKLTPPDGEAQARLVEDAFGSRPRFEAWLVFSSGLADPVGYAILFETYSSFLARPTLYLEDLFVLPEHRGHGIGSALLDHCIRLAHQRGCGRMEWTVLDWNVRAQKVYEALGAQRLSEWFLYRLGQDQIEKLGQAPGQTPRSTRDPQPGTTSDPARTSQGGEGLANS
jgi:GNAT superfamily N-acetyltransferase